MPQWKTIPEIAVELGTTYQGVMWICHKAGIKPQKQERIIPKKMTVNVVDMQEVEAYLKERK